MQKKRGYKVSRIGDANPDRYEERVADVMKEFFRSDIEFLPSGASTSPDMHVVRLHQIWEIKNIVGNAPNTIGHNISHAKYQSKNIIISLYRTKMMPKRAIGYIRRELANRHDVQRLILVTKENEIIICKK